MPLKLIPPGKRGRKYFYVRGTIKGVRYDMSTQTMDKEEAEERKAELENAIRNSISLEDAPVTFAYAAEEFKRFKNPKDYDIKRIDDVTFLIGEKFLDDITQKDVVDVAHELFPIASPATKNRSVLRPIASVLHYAAKNRWCRYIRFEAWKEPPPVNKVISDNDAHNLIKAAEKELNDAEYKVLLLYWLIKHGSRLSETLTVKWKDVDFARKTFMIYRGKTQTYDTFVLDDEVRIKLQPIKARVEKKNGKAGEKVTECIFPWRTRWGVYAWLIPMRKKLDIDFTPHMGRHTVGTKLKNLGAPLKVTMSKLGHKSYKSSLRYQADDIETVRSYSKQMTKLAKGKKKRKNNR